MLDALAEAKVGAVLDGGWGIDALLGEECRSHADVDLAVDREDLPRAVEALGALGFEPDETAEPGLPARLVMHDRAGRLVDLHPLRLDGEGNGWQELGDGAWGLYTVEGLNGRGTITGRPVRCISPEQQLRFHLGWPLTPTNRSDLERLAARFDLPLPPG